MIQAALRGPNGRFIGLRGSVLAAEHERADADQEILIENLDRPEGDMLEAGDRIVLCLARYDRVWRMAPGGSGWWRLGNRTAIQVSHRWPLEAGQVFTVIESHRLPRSVRVRLGLDQMKAYVSAGGGRAGSAAPYPLTIPMSLLIEDDGSLTAAPDQNMTRSAAVSFEVMPRSIKVFLRSPEHGLVREATAGGLRVDTAAPARNAVFTVVPIGSPLSRRLYHGDVVGLVSTSGIELAAVSRADHAVLGARNRPDGTPGDPAMLILTRQAGAGEVRDGDHVLLEEFGFGPTRKLAVRDGRPVLARAPAAGDASFALDLQVDLEQWRNRRSGNHALFAAHRPPRREEYAHLRREGRIALGPLPGTVPLKNFRLDSGEVCSTATETGESEHVGPWLFDAIHGFAWENSEPGTIPLKQYLRRNRDHFAAATRESESEAYSTNHVFKWIEGYVVAPPVGAPRGGPTLSLQIDDSSLLYLNRAPAGRGRGLLRVFDLGIIATQPRRVRRALVLSGGGAKGSFEVGAVRELYLKGHQFDIICGCSVGALNAVKLADGSRRSIVELERLWLDNVAQPGQIFREGHYVDIFSKLLDRLGGRGSDTLIGGIVGAIGGAFLLGPFGAPLGGAVGGLLGIEASGLDDHGKRMINFLITLLHSLHSMEPLRRLIAETLTSDLLSAIAASPIALRLGITNIGGGQYFSVGSPESGWTGDLRRCGRLFVEPDHQPGDTWLTRPIYGTDGWVMPLAEAVYASCTMPVFMEPYLVDLGDCDVLRAADRTLYTRLRPRLPDGLRSFLDATGLGTSEIAPGDLDLAAVEAALDAIIAEFPLPTSEQMEIQQRLVRDGLRGQASRRHYLFDGGLRDTIPLRTALRMGATDVTIVSCDPVQRAQYRYLSGFRALSGGLSALLDGMKASMNATPLTQHAAGLLGMWFNEVVRADLFAGLALNELRHWIERATRDLNRSVRDPIMAEFEAYWSTHSARLHEALGAGTWAGGRRMDDWRKLSKGATVRLIAPDRDVIDALDFENLAAVKESIELGARAARAPIQLSSA